jgi:hypothetical protein
MLLDKVHKRGLVEKREHAIKVLEIVLEQREGFGLGRERSVHSSLKKILKDIGLPLYPFVVVNSSI